MNEMKPNAILVIQTSSVGGMEARDIFDEHGVKRNINYLYFNTFNDLVAQHIVPDMPQLVFTSHVDRVFDSRRVAKEIKEINPTALVFALTTSLAPKPLEDLDGVCSKDTHGRQMAISLAKQLLAGKNRIEILRSFKPG